MTARPMIYGMRAWRIPRPAPMIWRSHVSMKSTKLAQENPKAVLKDALDEAINVSILDKYSYAYNFDHLDLLTLPNNYFLVNIFIITTKKYKANAMLNAIVIVVKVSY